MRPLFFIASLISAFLLALGPVRQPTAIVENNRTLARPYLTAPADFPTIHVTTPANGTGSGYVFLAPWKWQFTSTFSGSYLLMLDDQGQPVYYQVMRDNHRGLDFKKLPDGSLAYWSSTDNKYHILNQNYQDIRQVASVGYAAPIDQHDLIQLPGGHYLFMIYDMRVMDMSLIVQGGKTNAEVTGAVLQEVDENGQVVFEWSSWDEIPVTDTLVSLTTQQIDYVHANAVEVDTDGNLLLSSRHLDEITKINRQTGKIMWRLGGKQNQFTFINDPEKFRHQHDIRRLPNGHISLFDNHNDAPTLVSRGAEYELDEVNKTATLVWSYQNPLNTYSFAMGSLQRLPNGNSVIGWGSNLATAYTEVAADGTKAMEIALDSNNVSYRAYRFPWTGYPKWGPAVVVQPTGPNSVQLAISWNGATEAASWNIYGGTEINPNALLVNAPKTGFETTVTLNNAQAAYCQYRIQPLDSQGSPLAVGYPGETYSVSSPAAACDLQHQYIGAVYNFGP